MLLPTEHERLAKINDTTVAIPSTTLSALVAQQADKTPDAPALADARYQFSYREMRQQVVALARRLRERGVQTGDSVAVALPRSVFLTLALHGIVEAGAAWLPLDTGYPDDRLRMMLEDAKPKLLIATEEQLARFSDIPGWKVCATTRRCQKRMLHRWRYLNLIIRPILFLLPVLPADQKG